MPRYYCISWVILVTHSCYQINRMNRFNNLYSLFDSICQDLQFYSINFDFVFINFFDYHGKNIIFEKVRKTKLELKERFYTIPIFIELLELRKVEEFFDGWFVLTIN